MHRPPRLREGQHLEIFVGLGPKGRAPWERVPPREESPLVEERHLRDKSFRGFEVVQREAGLGKLVRIVTGQPTEQLTQDVMGERQDLDPHWVTSHA